MFELRVKKNSQILRSKRLIKFYYLRRRIWRLHVMSQKHASTKVISNLQKIKNLFCMSTHRWPYMYGEE